MSDDVDLFSYQPEPPPVAPAAPQRPAKGRKRTKALEPARAAPEPPTATVAPKLAAVSSPLAEVVPFPSVRRRAMVARLAMSRAGSLTERLAQQSFGLEGRACSGRPTSAFQALGSRFPDVARGAWYDDTLR